MASMPIYAECVAALGDPEKHLRRLRLAYAFYHAMSAAKRQQRMLGGVINKLESLGIF